MKVVIFLGLLAVAALALTHGEKSKLNFLLKKKLIGGPDSLPYFLRPGYKKPEVKPVAPVTAPETSGFSEDIKVKATEFKNKAHLHLGKLHVTLKGHLDRAHKFIKEKLAKKPEVAPTPAPAAEPVQESAFGDHVNKVKISIKGHLHKAHQWIKNKLAKKPEVAPTPAPAAEPVQESAFGDHINKVKISIKGHLHKAHQWIKSKFSKKPEATPTPAATPAPEATPEASGFTELKIKAKEHFNKIKTAIKTHAHKAHQWIKSKLAKKPEVAPTPAPVEEEPTQESAFGDHVNKVKISIKGHLHKAHQWIKSKFSKKPEVAPTPAPAAEPVAETSGFTEDIVVKATEIKNKAVAHGKRFHQWLKNKLAKTAPAPEATQ